MKERNSIWEKGGTNKRVTREMGKDDEQVQYVKTYV